MVTTTLSQIFERYFGARAVNYGITAEQVDAATIDVTLTFKAGIRYCCAEPGCNLRLLEPEDWHQLRQVIRDAGIEMACPMKVRLRGVVQDGALLSSSTALGFPESSEGYMYEREYVEK